MGRVVRTTRAPRGVDRDGRLGGHELREELERHGVMRDVRWIGLRDLSNESMRVDTSSNPISPAFIVFSKQLRVVVVLHSRCGVLFPTWSAVEVVKSQSSSVSSESETKIEMEVEMDGRTCMRLGSSLGGHSCAG